MTDFPWDVAIGLGIVLLGTLAIIAWVLMYDHLENKNAFKEGIWSEDDQQEH
jgi:hypothetical protein